MSLPENETGETVAVEPTVAVFAAPNALTAETVRGALIAEGIDAVIGEQVAAAYAGAFAVGEGFWGEVRVPAEQEAAAREILAAFESGQGIVTDTDVVEEPVDTEV